MKRILVAIDGSPLAARVVKSAAHLATLTGARLVLYRAIDTVAPDASRMASIEDGAELDLARHAQALPPEMVEACRVELATPWDGICRAAKASECDLVVIGSHGHGRLDRLLGTTASKVVNHTDRNVLVVRAPL